MITQIQLDPNSYCGSKCWYCPVRFINRRNPHVMTKEEFELVLNKIKEGVDESIISPSFTLWTSSYNDFLLDPILEEKLKLLRKFGYRTTILTNGIMLSKTLYIINNYRDVISGYSIDLPAGNSKDYEKYTGNPKDIFDTIIKGVTDLYLLDPDYYHKVVSFGVNGVYDSNLQKAQLVSPYEKMFSSGDTDKQVEQLKEKLPFFEDRIFPIKGLCDRAGYLSSFSINNSCQENRPYWNFPLGSIPTACNNGDRFNKWFHISSTMKVYVCCQDYLELYEFGDLATQSFKEIYISEKRSNVIELAKQTLCTKCCFAK